MIRNLIAAVIAAFAFNAFAAIDANQATRADLETVKGIGPGLSGKIVDARKTGEFKDWSDLVDRVGGIGAGNAAKLSQAGLTVRGGSFDGQSTKAAAPTNRTKATKDGSSTKPARAPKNTDKAAKASAASPM